MGRAGGSHDAGRKPRERARETPYTPPVVYSYFDSYFDNQINIYKQGLFFLRRRTFCILRRHQNLMTVHSLKRCSDGQAGHGDLGRWVWYSWVTDCWDSTCPHLSIIGGSSGDAWSLEIGHAKME